MGRRTRRASGARKGGWEDRVSNGAILAITAIIFLAFCGGFWAYWELNGKARKGPFEDALELRRVTRVGEVLHATATESWSELSDPEKQAALERLRDAARKKGYRAFILMDAQGTVAARWNGGGAVALLKPGTGT